MIVYHASPKNNIKKLYNNSYVTIFPHIAYYMGLYYKDTKKPWLNNDLEKEVLEILKKEIKGNKELESRMEEVSTKVLVNLYKTLWMKRNFWVNKLVK